LFVGLMSGTSLDGVDAALVEFVSPGTALINTVYLPFPGGLKAELHALQSPGPNELDRAAKAGNELSRLYAEAVLALLAQAGIPPAAISACGCHGQTIRHRPDAGYTLQIGNPALLAELTGISVVADFRSGDIAAGGQGAPLVPAFHAAVFGADTKHRVIVNIGGVANLSDLPARGARGRRRYWSGLACRAASPTCRPPCPAGSSSGWPSPGRWWPGRPCCWPMNLRAIWTNGPRQTSRAQTIGSACRFACALSSEERLRIPTCTAGTISRTRRMTHAWLNGLPS